MTDRHFDSKLLRLIVGTRHERHSTDPSRKPQVILNSGGGAGLTTERVAIKHQDRKSLIVFAAGSGLALTGLGGLAVSAAQDRHV